ncbi:hypothetical protein EIN_515520 [Entamoeba invadens IP1]|uniref:Leucine rich repeat containing protein BspA family protein n=1 Tax=Entamoeba invadens IP1 TaxID=370355 RepID=L7FKT6_ENTIV|nr:hypothetical protein EIN_515520 [Entamoeba invadens IP1]ELP86202.1 hypothetical protein EIN_515520 [Entamoeba invadens IP1]|eukprot:XP_004185548.1 hypothetical protein EIN_515520 [Entamoeba invadens IP1]
MNTSLDRYSMMIVSKYFDCLYQFEKLVLVCKKFKEIPLMFHFNPIQWNPKMVNYFENVETLHLYDKQDKFVPGFFQYYVHYPIELSRYKKLNKKIKVICPHITFSSGDLQNNYSYKEASILSPNAFKSKFKIFTDLDVFSNIRKTLFITQSDVRRGFSIDCEVNEICESAFSGNKNLSDKYIAPTIKVIRKNALSDCDLKQLDLSHIEVFEKQENLKMITALTLNSKSYFNNLYQCNSLQSIKIVGTQSVNCKAACWMKTLDDIKKLIVDEYVYSCKDCELFNGLLPFNITNLKTIEKDVRLKDLEIDTYQVPDNISLLYAENFLECKNIKKLLLPKCLNTRFDFSILETIKEAALPYKTNKNIYSSGQLTSITFLDDDFLKNQTMDNINFQNLKNIEFAHPPTDGIYRTNLDYRIFKFLIKNYKIEGEVVLYNVFESDVKNGIFKIPDEVTVIECYLLNRCYHLKEIWVNKNTWLIKSNSFHDCKNLVLVKNLLISVIVEKFAFKNANPNLYFDIITVYP